MTVTANSIVTPQKPRCEVQNFVQGTDTAGTLKTIFTPDAVAANGAKVTAVILSTDDGTAAHDVGIFLTRSGTDYLLGTVNVPINAGNSASVPGVSGLDVAIIPGLPIDNDGQAYLLLEDGDLLKATFATALTAGKRINAVVIGADF